MRNGYEEKKKEVSVDLFKKRGRGRHTSNQTTCSSYTRLVQYFDSMKFDAFGYTILPSTDFPSDMGTFSSATFG
jgi:hypothetical protein